MRSAPDSIKLDRNKGVVIYKGKAVKLDAGNSLYTSLYVTPDGDIFILEVNLRNAYVSGQLIERESMQTIDKFFTQDPDGLWFNGEQLKKSFYDYSESRQADIVCQSMSKCQRGRF